MTISNIRQLTASDKIEVESFLKAGIEQTLFLLYNILRGGLNYSGKPGQSIFFGSFQETKITSVMSLSWNGHMQIFTPHAMEDICDKFIPFLKKHKKEVLGISGPPDHVQQALQYLNLDLHPKLLYSIEKLYTLHLENLQPIMPQAGRVCVLRKATPEDYNMLVEWQIAYALETLGSKDNRQLRESTQRRIQALVQSDADYMRIFEVDGVAVSRTNITAALPEAIMLGGIWTPPEHRNKGYARSAVAAHLLEQKKSGVDKAVLFTNSPAATKAYKALGFKEAGNFSLVLFETPWTP